MGLRQKTYSWGNGEYRCRPLKKPPPYICPGAGAAPEGYEAAGTMAVEGALPALRRAASTSSWVRFLDWRKATRFSRGKAATWGSWRTVPRIK